MKRKSTKAVNVIVSDDALGEIDAVAERLKSKGLKITQVLPVTGMISGHCAPEGLSTLASVAGVQAVEEDLEVHLDGDGTAV